MFEEDLLYGQTRDAVGVSEDALEAIRLLATAVIHDAPVLKKEYLDLVCTLFGKVQKTQHKSNPTNWQLPEKYGKNSEL